MWRTSPSSAMAEFALFLRRQSYLDHITVNSVA